MTFLVFLDLQGARYISSCHLVDFTAHEVTSLMQIRWRAFFSSVLIMAEMLIIQTCRALNTGFIYLFMLYELGFLGY